MHYSKNWLLILITFFATTSITLSFFYKLTYHADLMLTSSDNNIHFNHSYLISLDDSETIDAVFNSSHFKPIINNKMKAEFGEHSYWHKLQVINKSKFIKSLTLLLDNYVIAEIDIYVFKADQVYDYVERGNARWPKELKARALPSYDFELSPSEELIFYIRSKSKGSNVLPLALYEQSNFRNYEQYLFILWGALTGLVLIMAFYNLILFVGVKDIVYVYYVGYMLSILLDLGLLHGFLVFTLPQEIINFLTLHITAVHYFVIYFALMFALKYLKFDQDNKWIYKIGKWTGLVMLLMALSTIYIKEHIAVQIFFAIQTIIYLFIFFLLVKKFKGNFSWAKYYFISWMPIYVGGIITPAFFIGLIEYNFWTRNALLISIMAEASLISMGLANRLRSNKEKILHNITHDQVFGLPNIALITSLINEKKQKLKCDYNYTIVVAEIKHYHTFSPYLSRSQLMAVIQKITTTIESKFRKLRLLTLEKDGEKRTHHFIVKDSIIGFIIKGHNVKVIEEKLQQLDAIFPLIFSCTVMDLTLECTFGISLSTDGDYPANITSKALQVINTAKKKSKIFARYTSSLAEENQRKILIAAELKKALESNSLELHHQPQINLATSEVWGSEVLIRWNHPVLGFISPDEFILIAEDTGLITQLTHWVIKNAYRQHARLSQHVYQHMISINISVLDIVDDVLCRSIIDLAAKYNVLSSTVILEVTETAITENEDKFTKNLQFLAKAGFHIAIDDFGTGYSSLSYLTDKPIYELKIDKSLIVNLDSSKKSELIVKATVSMAKSLNIKIIAEGIESLEVAKKLTVLGCDIAQGYYFAKPMQFESYLSWIKKHKNT